MDRLVAAGGLPVITLSETFGCHAIEIGNRLSRLLNLPMHGLTNEPADITDAQAGQDKFQVFSSLLMSGDMEAEAAATMHGTHLEVVRELAALNNRHVLTSAREGGIVLGRHAAFILREWPNAVHILLDAARIDRVSRVASESGIPAELVSAEVQFEDHLMEQLARYVHGYDPKDLSLYDFVVNVCRTGDEGAAELIASAVHSKVAFAG